MRSDTRKHKIGDGATAWSALSYAGDFGGLFRPRTSHKTRTTAS